MSWIRDTSGNKDNKPVNLALVRSITIKDTKLVFSYDASTSDTVWIFKTDKDIQAVYKSIESGMRGI